MSREWDNCYLALRYAGEGGGSGHIGQKRTGDVDGDREAAKCVPSPAAIPVGYRGASSLAVAQAGLGTPEGCNAQ